MFDYIQIISQLFGKLWYFIPIVFLLVIVKSSWGKGKTGEAIINFGTRLFLSKEDYYRIKNVTLPTQDGTTQVDHIIVSKYGLFVIETKNMKGWIFGNQNQKTWTQKIYKHSNKFQNPLHQNYKHTKTLESLLSVPQDNIHSLIIFIGDSKFKTEMPPNVTHAGGYIGYIKSKKKVVFSQNEVKRIIEVIESKKLSRSLTTHIGHVKHIKTIVSEKQNLK